MAIALATKLAEQLEAAAEKAGIAVVDGTESSGFNGLPTEKYTLMLARDAAKRDVAVEKTAEQIAGNRETLELSSNFDLARPGLQEHVHEYLLQSAKRLRNPRPDVYVTLTGMPVSFGAWQWPFHRSVSGADSYVVHGETRLEDGATPPEQQLRARIAASMTVTFAEVVPAPEQPFAEAFIYNAVRKLIDQGQIELVKSGNRQVVPITTRYYSPKQNRFVFNDTDEQQRQDFIASKVYWLSAVLGKGAPVWVLDPRDAQYLNTTVADLKKSVTALAGDGIVRLDQDLEFASATEPLIGHRADYEKDLADALEFTRPTFNEEMRSGHTNM